MKLRNITHCWPECQYTLCSWARPIDVPAMDRARVTAVSLSGVLYFPKLGDTFFSPIGAFYLKRVWAESRTRNVISVFVNDLEYDKSFGNVELVARFDTTRFHMAKRKW